MAVSPWKHRPWRCFASEAPSGRLPAGRCIAPLLHLLGGRSFLGWGFEGKPSTRPLLASIGRLGTPTSAASSLPLTWRKGASPSGAWVAMARRPLELNRCPCAQSVGAAQKDNARSEGQHPLACIRSAVRWFIRRPAQCGHKRRSGLVTSEGKEAKAPPLRGVPSHEKIPDEKEGHRKYRGCGTTWGYPPRELRRGLSDSEIFLVLSKFT